MLWIRSRSEWHTVPIVAKIKSPQESIFTHNEHDCKTDATVVCIYFFTRHRATLHATHWLPKYVTLTLLIFCLPPWSVALWHCVYWYTCTHSSVLCRYELVHLQIMFHVQYLLIFSGVRIVHTISPSIYIPVYATRQCALNQNNQNETSSQNWSLCKCCNGLCGCGFSPETECFKHMYKHLKMNLLNLKTLLYEISFISTHWSHLCMGTSVQTDSQTVYRTTFSRNCFFWTVTLHCIFVDVAFPTPNWICWIAYW